MIEATSKPTRYQVKFTNGRNSATADTTSDKGGGDSGFRPHELLEAALAACMNMTATMYADKHGIPLEQVNTRVSLDRSGPKQAVFNCAVKLKGKLTIAQKKAVTAAARSCPVRKTLLRGVIFSE